MAFYWMIFEYPDEEYSYKKGLARTWLLLHATYSKECLPSARGIRELVLFHCCFPPYQSGAIAVTENRYSTPILLPSDRYNFETISNQSCRDSRDFSY